MSNIAFLWLMLLILLVIELCGVGIAMRCRYFSSRNFSCNFHTFLFLSSLLATRPTVPAILCIFLPLMVTQLLLFSALLCSSLPLSALLCSSSLHFSALLFFSSPFSSSSTPPLSYYAVLGSLWRSHGRDGSHYDTPWNKTWSRKWNGTGCLRGSGSLQGR